MKRYDDTIDPGSSREAWHAREGTRRSSKAQPAFSLCSHGRAAHALAVEDGLLSEEVDEILAGRSMVAAFPVEWREDPQEYALRAVAEMMVAYLAFEPAGAKTEARPWAAGAVRGPHPSTQGTVRS